VPRLFFSGTQHESIDTDARIPRDETWYRLGSCHESSVKGAFSRAELTVRSTDGNCELMFDSGAFTAWSKGREVDYDVLCHTYDDALKQFHGKCRAVWLINLDKIPAEKGRSATKAELDQAMEVSNKNFEKMLARYGEHVIPVFHQDEPTVQLLLLAKHPYICLSPRNDVHEALRVEWSVTMHRILQDHAGDKPIPQTHGLAATGSTMMRFVPWGSVDSAAWIFAAANGSVMLPTGKVLAISPRSPAQKSFDQHYRSLPPILKQEVDSMIAGAGFTLPELEERAEARITFNRISFMSMARRPHDPIKTQLAGGLFDA
jgi:hypothetical protein